MILGILVFCGTLLVINESKGTTVVGSEIGVTGSAPNGMVKVQGCFYTSDWADRCYSGGHRVIRCAPSVATT